MRSRFYPIVLQKEVNELHPNSMPVLGCSCRLTAGVCFCGHEVQENTFSLISTPGGPCPLA